MSIRYPQPLRPGDVIGVTAPSSGVEPELRPRLDFAVEVIRDRGYDVPEPLLSWLDGDGPVEVTGRLVGGCIETLCNLAGTPYARVAAFAETHAPEGLLVYVEAAGDDAYTICRNLHGMRLAGFFDAANAVRVGRTRAPDTPTLSQYDAVLDALGGLGVPLVADVECGHVPPYLPLVNGALGRLRLDGRTGSLTQTLA